MLEDLKLAVLDANLILPEYFTQLRQFDRKTQLSWKAAPDRTSPRGWVQRLRYSIVPLAVRSRNL